MPPRHLRCNVGCWSRSHLGHRRGSRRWHRRTHGHARNLSRRDYCSGGYGPLQSAWLAIPNWLIATWYSNRLLPSLTCVPLIRSIQKSGLRRAESLKGMPTGHTGRSTRSTEMRWPRFSTAHWTGRCLHHPHRLLLVTCRQQARSTRK